MLVYLDPQAVLTYVALGHLLMRQGKEPEARRYLAQARTLLAGYQAADVLPDAGGLTAGHLAALLAGKEPVES